MTYEEARTKRRQKRTTYRKEENIESQNPKVVTEQPNPLKESVQKDIQNIHLVIAVNDTSQDCLPAENEIEEFRVLANQIMEEYPEYDDDDWDDSHDTTGGPTFTYPKDSQPSFNPSETLSTEVTHCHTCTNTDADADTEPWLYIERALMSGNKRAMILFETLGISPEQGSLNNFYYEHYEPTSQRHHEWRCLDSLNTILGNDTFKALCLGDGWP